MWGDGREAAPLQGAAEEIGEVRKIIPLHFEPQKRPVSTLIITMLWYSDVKMEEQVGGLQDIFFVFIVKSYWHDVAQNKTELVRSNHNVFYFCEPEVRVVSLWREVEESIKPRTGCVVFTQHKTRRYNERRLHSSDQTKSCISGFCEIGFVLPKSENVLQSLLGVIVPLESKTCRFCLMQLKFPLLHTARYITTH